jgi:response regulator NasT
MGLRRRLSIGRVTAPTEGLRILAADEDRDALNRTAATLEQLGHQVTATAIDLAEVTEAVAREDPQLSVVVVHTDDDHALDLIEEIAAFSGGPVVALISGEEGDFVGRAAERGIYAAARDGDAQAMQDAIEVAMHRHAEAAQLAEHVDRLETALERRAVIERAKGILMERHGVSDREAFERLRAHARSINRTVVEVSIAVAEGHALLGDGRRPD